MNIKLTILLLSIICLALGADTRQCPYDSTFEKIQSDLGGYLKNAPNGSFLKHANVIWPTCEKIKTSLVNDTSLIKSSIMYQNWTYKYLYKFPIHKLICLKNMKRGDDWVIGFHDYGEMFIQVIDGRTITILVKFDDGLHININEVDLYKVVRKKLDKVVKFNKMGLFDSSEIEFTHKEEGYVEGYFTNTYNNLSDYKKDFLWTNGEYLVLDIMKMRYPFRSPKNHDIYPYEKIINSISRDDKRSFSRFRKSENVDLKEEMLEIFPWVRDSINYYKNEYLELDGRTPVYILEE